MSSSPHGSRAAADILEELQLIAVQNLEKLDINKYYEVVCELGKGTYGKVDLVVHKIRGKTPCPGEPVLVVLVRDVSRWFEATQCWFSPGWTRGIIWWSTPCFTPTSVISN